MNRGGRSGVPVRLRATPTAHRCWGYVAFWQPGAGQWGGRQVRRRQRGTGWTIDDFFTRNEHFYHVDLGWSSFVYANIPIQSRGPMDRNNYSVTVWYKNRQESGPPEAHGIAAKVNFMTSRNSMVFLRGGWSDGFTINGNVSVGFGWRPAAATSHLLGFGVGWAKPSDNVLRDQFTMELFYRFSVTPNFAITPDIQLVVDPALNPGKDELWVAGVRRVSHSEDAECHYDDEPVQLAGPYRWPDDPRTPSRITMHCIYL